MSQKVENLCFQNTSCLTANALQTNFVMWTHAQHKAMLLEELHEQLISYISNFLNIENKYTV